VSPSGRGSPVLEVGGSHVTAALVDVQAGAVVPDSSRRATLGQGGTAAEILGALIGCGSSLGVETPERWAVALPGPFDYERGIAMFEGVAKFDALHGVDVGAALAEGLPGPPTSIAFVNDAEAFMWGERLFGRAAGYDRSVGITLGTGVGSAFFADGVALRSGQGVPPEGYVHLLEIDGRPLEDTVSTRALVREYRRRAGQRSQSPPGRAGEGVVVIAERARAGDEVAAGVFSVAFARLGAALQPWLQAFGAQVLVVGGAMTGSWDLIGSPLRDGLHANGQLPDLVVTVAAHPLDAGLLGAAARAQQIGDLPGEGERKASWS
jgi:glucokinase